MLSFGASKVSWIQSEKERDMCFHLFLHISSKITKGPFIVSLGNSFQLRIWIHMESAEAKGCFSLGQKSRAWVQLH